MRKEDKTPYRLIEEETSLYEDDWTEEDEEDMEDNEGTPITQEQEDFAEEITIFLQSLIDEENIDTNDLGEDFTSNNSLQAHFYKHCLGENVNRKSSNHKIFYDFKNQNDYSKYEKNISDHLKNVGVVKNILVCESPFIIQDVNNQFTELFKGNNYLIFGLLWDFRNSNGPVQLCLHAYPSNVTTNYSGGNTIDICVRNYSANTITLYAVDASRIKSKLATIIKKYSTHPVVVSADDKKLLDDSRGKEDAHKILEDINEEKLSEIESLINDLYELRKTSIEEGGEYSIGNLIFKEFRNKGYLDNLKDRMRELINKELSLEETKKRKKKKGISNGEMGWFTKFNTGNVPFNIGFFNMVASGNFGDGGEISGDVAGDSSAGSVAVGESLKGRNKKRYLKESMFDDKAYEYIYNYLKENHDGDDLEDSTKTILEYFINVYPESINYIDYWGKDKKTIEEIETRYSNKYITDLLSSEGFPNKLIDDYIRNYALDLKKRKGDK